MSNPKHQAQSDALAQDILRGADTGRRGMFHVAAWGAATAMAAPGVALAQAPAPAAAPAAAPRRAAVS